MLTIIIVNAVCVFVAAAAGASTGVRMGNALERRRQAGKLYLVQPPTARDPSDPKDAA